MSKRFLTSAAAAALGALVLIGPAAAQPAGPADATTAAAPVTNAITIRTTGDNYLVSGRLRPGTAAIRWVNDDDEMHMMAMARLKPGVTIADIKAALAKGEDHVAALLLDPIDTTYGQPAMVTAHRGETVTMTQLKAGTYGLICFMTDADGTPHWKQGMITEITVGGAAARQAPRVSGTIVVDDHRITLPRGFTGRGTYAVLDRGTRQHAFSLARLDAGVSLGSFVASVGQAEISGTQPEGGAIISGIDALSPGQKSYVTLYLAPGRFGYISPVDIAGPRLPAQSGTFTLH